MKKNKTSQLDSDNAGKSRFFWPPPKRLDRSAVAIGIFYAEVVIIVNFIQPYASARPLISLSVQQEDWALIEHHPKR